MVMIRFPSHLSLSHSAATTAFKNLGGTSTSLRGLRMLTASQQRGVEGGNQGVRPPVDRGILTIEEQNHILQLQSVNGCLRRTLKPFSANALQPELT